MPFGTASATNTNVTATTTSTTLFTAQDNTANVITARSVHNDSTSILYLKRGGGTASATSFSTKIQPDSYYEFPQPVFPGLVTGVWAAANGAARCTEDS
jgi:tartrate dehydratase alpha subunit/fumarate hydratase class I-like protein